MKSFAFVFVLGALLLAETTCLFAQDIPTLTTPGSTASIPQWASRELKGLKNDYRLDSTRAGTFELPLSGCRVYMPKNRGIRLEPGRRSFAASDRAGSLLYYQASSLLCASEVSAKQPKKPFDTSFAVYSDASIKAMPLGTRLSNIDVSLVYFLGTGEQNRPVLLFRVQSVDPDGITLWLYL